MKHKAAQLMAAAVLALLAFKLLWASPQAADPNPVSLTLHPDVAVVLREMIPPDQFRDLGWNYALGKLLPELTAAEGDPAKVERAISKIKAFNAIRAAYREP